MTIVPILLALSLGPASGTVSPTSDMSLARVKATGTTTSRALKDWTAEVLTIGPPDWGTTATPWIIGHAAAPQFGPEETFDTFDRVASAGAAVECDLWRTADGSYVCMHDSTTTRTTGVTGTIAQTRGDDLRRMNAANHSPWTTSMAGRWMEIPTFEQYLTRYRKSLLIPEIKGGRGYEVAAMINARGMGRGLLVQSFVTDRLAEVYAADPTIRLALLANNDTEGSVANAQTAHAWAVLTNWRNTSQETIAALKAAGIRVIPWTVNDIETAELLFGYGADGVFTDDPEYLRLVNTSTGTGVTVAPPAAPVQTTIDLTSSGTYPTIGSGWRGRRPKDGTFGVSSGYATFVGGTAGIASDYCVIYPGVRTPEAPWSLTTYLKVVLAAGDTTRYITAKIGYPSDTDIGTNYYGGPTAGNGYIFLYREAGGVELIKVLSGTPTTIATATWDAITTGTVVPIRIDTTANAITVTRTDNNQTITAFNSERSRRGFFSIGASGLVPGLGASTLTY